MLGCLKIRWHALHIFADVFQGCYKNRTDGTNDYRYFAAFYLILRIIILLLNVFVNLGGLGWAISAAVLIVRIPIVCSAASIQEELAEHSGQCNSSITGSCITVDTLQFRDTKKVD